MDARTAEDLKAVRAALKSGSERAIVSTCLLFVKAEAAMRRIATRLKAEAARLEGRAP